jgi:hypothetical protein
MDCSTPTLTEGQAYHIQIYELVQVLVFDRQLGILHGVMEFEGEWLTTGRSSHSPGWEEGTK